MKVTQQELFNYIKAEKPNVSTYPNLNDMVIFITKKLDIKENDKLRECIKTQIMLCKRETKEMHKRSADKRTTIGDPSLFVIDSEEYEPVSTVVNTTPPPVKKRKTFHELGNRMRRERTQPIADMLNKFVESEGLSMSELLGYLMYRMCYNTNKTLSNTGSDIFSGTFSENHFDLHEAIAIMHTLTLSKNQMQQLKTFIETKGIRFPSTTELLEARKALRPVIKSVLDGKGVAVDYEELVKSTVAAQLNVFREDKELPAGDLKMIFKDGCDGAGLQVKWKSKSMIEAAENMFQYSLVPLQLKVGDTILWKNPVPNSPNCLRPVYLIREKESDEEMMNLVIVATDAARQKLNQNGVKIDLEDGKEISVGVEIKDTMKDLKLKKAISGLGGADCILCKTRQCDWIDVEKIEEGFTINRTNEDTVSLYNELISKSDDGEIKKSNNDFNEREGITKNPLTTSDQHSITITHSYINVTTWFLKVLYRLNAEYFVWTESKTVLGEHIRKGKERVFDMVINDTGLVLDVVCSGGAKGGTSTDGKQGRRFFSEELVPTIKRATKDKYHEDILAIHALLSAIMRVVSSQQRVNLPVYMKNCKAVSLLIANYKWVKVNHTLHGLIHHSGELIAHNDGYALGALSEEGLEATNKFIRRFLELLSQKTYPIDQLTDVMSRLLER